MRTEQMSMLEVAEMLMEKKKKPQKFIDLAKEVAEVKGYNFEAEIDKVSQFYTDMTTSSKFVYCGEETFDLKVRQPLDLFEKDGAHFNEGRAEIEVLEKKLEVMEAEALAAATKQSAPASTKAEAERKIPEAIEVEEKQYIDDVISGGDEFEDSEYEEDFVEDEYEDMYDEE